MEIREAKKDDMKKIILLWKKLMEYHSNLAKKTQNYEFYWLRSDSEKKWKIWAEKSINSKTGRLLVAEDKGKMIGYSLTAIKSNISIYKIRKIGHFHDLYIEPEYRRKGVGRKFLEMGCEWFRSKKIQHFSIAAHSLNPNAIKIYRKFGFSDFHIEMRMKL